MTIMVLRPLDIVVLLKLQLPRQGSWSQMGLAAELGISSQSVNVGLKRAEAARLYDPQRRQPIRTSLEEALIHGIRYFMPPERGPMTRGMPTAWAASPLKEQLMESTEPPPVWPTPDGSTRGFALIPLHAGVPRAASADPRLYELLALVDAIREGRPREVRLAREALRHRLREDS